MNDITMKSPSLEIHIAQLVAKSFNDTIARELYRFAVYSKDSPTLEDDVVPICAFLLTKFLRRLQDVSDELQVPLSDVISEAITHCSRGDYRELQYR